MKKNYLKFISVFIVIGILFIIYITRVGVPKGTGIDLTGKNDTWRASLNVITGYDNELVITLVTEEFDIPSEVFVDVLVKNKSVYSQEIEKGNDDFPHAGIYRGYFDTVKYLEKNYNNVTLVVKSNDETITIPLEARKTN